MRNARTNANMTSLFFANVLYWVCAGVYSPFLSAHYTSLGLSAAQTGILLAATPVCALAIQPLWSTIADKLGRRRAVIVILCLAAAVLAPLYYLASTFAPVLLVTFAFSAFFSGLLPLATPSSSSSRIALAWTFLAFAWVALSAMPSSS